VSLYKFYLKADEEVDNNSNKQDINDTIDDIEVNVNILARFKRHLHEEDSVENRNEVERYLVDGCEDHNDDKLYILGWWKSNASKYKILSKVAQHVLVIPISIMASESTFSTQAVVYSTNFEVLYLQQQFKHLFVVKIGYIMDQFQSISEP